MNEQKFVKKFTIVQLGHLGVGGVFGIAPRGREQNNQQEWIRKCWDESKKIFGIPRKYPTLLIVGGEPIEGRNKKEEEEGIWIPRLDDQIKASAKVIAEWIGTETKVLILYSHTYHGSSEMRVEALLETELKTLFPNNEIISGIEFKRSYFGKTLRFRHGDSGGYVYLATGNERNIKFNLQEVGLGKVTKVDQNYEFHTHRLASAIYETLQSTWCPCWKLLDIFGQFKKPDAWCPDIGMMITTFEKRYGSIRVNNDALIFHAPFEFEDLEQSKIQFKGWLDRENRKDQIRVKKLLSKKDEKVEVQLISPEKDSRLHSILAREEGD